MWEIYQWECRPLLWHQEQWCVKCDLQKGINQLHGHKSTGMGFHEFRCLKEKVRKLQLLVKMGVWDEVHAGLNEWLSLFFFKVPEGGLSTSPRLLRMNHLPHIFCSGCSQTSPWSPTVKSCWGWKEGGEDRTGEDRRGEEKDPLLLLHIQKKRARERERERERDHRIDFN